MKSELIAIWKQQMLAISTCALLDSGNVRCWGLGNSGQLDYGITNDIGDDETPGSLGTFVTIF